MVQWAKPLKGKGEASQVRNLLANWGEASDTDEQTRLQIMNYVLGICVFVDVGYLFLHVRVRHRGECGGRGVGVVRFMCVLLLSGGYVPNLRLHIDVAPNELMNT